VVRLTSGGRCLNYLSAMTWKKPFREAYLERFQCSPERFERDVFRRGLHRRALPLAWVIRQLAPAYFDLEINTIRYLGNSRSSEEFRSELDSYRSEYRRKGGFLRTMLAVRLSGTRLVGILMAIREPRDRQGG
jgi:hypothetical protein